MKNQYDSDEREIENKSKRRKVSEYNNIFKDVSIYDIENRQFIMIPLISKSDEYTGDPFLAVNITSTKRKFAISLLLKLNMMNQKKETISHQIETVQRKIEKTNEVDLGIEDIFKEFAELMENMGMNESGLIFKDIISMHCKIAKIKTIRGWCYSIVLPEFLNNKKCLYNPKSSGNNCFADCIEKYGKIHDINFYLGKYNGFTSIKKMPEIEKELGISINIFYLTFNNDKAGSEFKIDKNNQKIFREEENSKNCEDVYTLLYPKAPRLSIENDCNLLLYKKHYILITDIKKLLNIKKFKCYNCMCDFESKDLLNEHLFYCKSYDPLTVKFPQ